MNGGHLLRVQGICMYLKSIGGHLLRSTDELVTWYRPLPHSTFPLPSATVATDFVSAKSCDCGGI